METTRLSTKGRIVIPREMRTARAWGPGTEFTVEEMDDGILLHPASRFPRTTLKDVVGCLRSKRKAKSITQMQHGIQREVFRRHDRGRY